jgi:hypothetical protein
MHYTWCVICLELSPSPWKTARASYDSGVEPSTKASASSAVARKGTPLGHGMCECMLSQPAFRKDLSRVARVDDGFN